MIFSKLLINVLGETGPYKSTKSLIFHKAIVSFVLPRTIFNNTKVTKLRNLYPNLEQETKQKKNLPTRFVKHEKKNPIGNWPMNFSKPNAPNEELNL